MVKNLFEVRNLADCDAKYVGMHLVEDESPAEIALCTLGAYNLGKVQKLSDIKKMADALVPALDNLLDIQEYPVLAAKIATVNRRPLGIGVINFAYYLASRDLQYTDPEALVAVHELFESIQYYSLRASCDIARVKGPCPLFNETKYANGILPIDTYKKDVDDLVPHKLIHDWEELRSDILKYGLRNSTLTSLMPSETSSQISNATNGIEPPRSLVSIKQSKNGGSMPQVVPHIGKLKNKYQLLWDTPGLMEGYINIVAVMQKFVDQSISANLSYNPDHFVDNQIPVTVLLKDLLNCYKFGVKTLYYHNTYDGKSEEVTDDGSCEGGACKI